MNEYLQERYTRFFKYIKKQPKEKFMSIMDLSYAASEINEKLPILENNITKLQEEIITLQKQLKISSSETKSQLQQQIKQIGSQKKEIQNNIDNLLQKIGNIKYKLVNLGPNIFFVSNNSQIFSEYAINIVSKNLELKELFIKRMSEFYLLSFISDYAKKLANKEKEGDKFKKLSILPSFQDRNIPQANNVFQNDFLNAHIRSFLKQQPEELTEDMLNNLLVSFKEFIDNTGTRITPKELLNYINNKTKDMNKKNISLEKAEYLLRKNRLLGGKRIKKQTIKNKNKNKKRKTHRN